MNFLGTVMLWPLGKALVYKAREILKGKLACMGTVEKVAACLKSLSSNCESDELGEVALDLECLQQLYERFFPSRSRLQARLP